jgi:hypothetical protein
MSEEHDGLKSLLTCEWKHQRHDLVPLDHLRGLNLENGAFPDTEVSRTYVSASLMRYGF